MRKQQKSIAHHISLFFRKHFTERALYAQLHPLPKKAKRLSSPQQFTYPFCYRPHKICRLVANQVINYCYNTPEMVPKEGKMFGILIVEYKGERYYLRAFSGIYNGSYHHKGFVPPIVDLQDPKGHFRQEEQEIVAITQQIQRLYGSLPNESSAKEDTLTEITRLKALRKEKSQELQTWTFHQFRMKNAEGGEADLIDIFKDYKSPFPEEEYIAYKEGRITVKPKGKYGVPPGGAGECCLPKMLQYAYLHGLKPICMEEFWIGPSKGNQMRVEKNFYPACQHKCVPILTFMMQGLNVEENPLFERARQLLDEVRILHEEEDFIIVYKPSGLLSVPSKNHGEPSLQAHLLSQNPNLHLMHRLDQDTSGVMIVAKTPEACGWIQQLFTEHLIKKKYVALLEEGETATPTGTISLPLSRNPFDSPRQVVDHRFGKPASTYYEFTGPNRIELYPESGRTHQLRVHCAHPEGLGRPIKGDILYGTASDRLYLHAETLGFCHPLTGKWVHFTAPSPF